MPTFEFKVREKSAGVSQHTYEAIESSTGNAIAVPSISGVCEYVFN